MDGWHAAPSDRHVCAQNRVDGLYIVLISMHGLIRGQHMELGRDADTGGQVSSRQAGPDDCGRPEPVYSATSIAWKRWRSACSQFGSGWD